MFRVGVYRDEKKSFVVVITIWYKSKAATKEFAVALGLTGTLTVKYSLVK